MNKELIKLLREARYYVPDSGRWTGSLKERIDAALAQAEAQEKQEPMALGAGWQACRKKPVVVHVREQRAGETHVFTREGITPLKPDDLIMSGVEGERYPIGRELFEKTYDLVPDGGQPAAPEVKP